MKVYEINQTEREISEAYDRLIDAVSKKVRLLAESSKPITSIMGVKRNLLRIKQSCVRPDETYEKDGKNGFDNETESKREFSLSEEEITLVTEILETMGVDLNEAVGLKIIGVKEMKRRLVKWHYGVMSGNDIAYKTIKEQLSKRYGMSVSSIEKLVYRRK